MFYNIKVLLIQDFFYFVTSHITTINFCCDAPFILKFFIEHFCIISITIGSCTTKIFTQPILLPKSQFLIPNSLLLLHLFNHCLSYTCK